MEENKLKSKILDIYGDKFWKESSSDNHVIEDDIAISFSIDTGPFRADDTTIEEAEITTIDGARIVCSHNVETNEWHINADDGIDFWRFVLNKGNGLLVTHEFTSSGNETGLGKRYVTESLEYKRNNYAYELTHWTIGGEQFESSIWSRRLEATQKDSLLLLEISDETQDEPYKISGKKKLSSFIREHKDGIQMLDLLRSMIHRMSKCDGDFLKEILGKSITKSEELSMFFEELEFTDHVYEK